MDLFFEGEKVKKIEKTFLFLSLHNFLIFEYKYNERIKYSAKHEQTQRRN